MNKNGLIGIITIAIAVAVGINYCKQTPATDRDIICRAIVRDGRSAKTQAEYDFAKDKFGKHCNGWVEPNK